VVKRTQFKFLMTKGGGLEQIEDDIKLYEQYLAKDSNRDWERKGLSKMGTDPGGNSALSNTQGRRELRQAESCHLSIFPDIFCYTVTSSIQQDNRRALLERLLAERASRKGTDQVAVSKLQPPQTDLGPTSVAEPRAISHAQGNQFLPEDMDKVRPKQETREELIQRLLREKRERDARKQSLMVANEPRSTIRSSTPDSLDGLRVSDHKSAANRQSSRPRPSSAPRQRAVLFREILAEGNAGTMGLDFRSPSSSLGRPGSQSSEKNIFAGFAAASTAPASGIRARPSSAPRERPPGAGGAGGGASGPGEFRPASAAAPNRHRRDAVARERETQLRRDMPFRPKVNAELDGGIVIRQVSYPPPIPYSTPPALP
jgi:hypothetical protein